jgi:hypothetical protein
VCRLLIYQGRVLTVAVAEHAGNLHYFSLSVPSLRFIAAKFASEDEEAIKNLWSNAYDAIERKKRMGYPY